MIRLVRCANAVASAGHAGHGAAEDPQLRDAHRARRSASSCSMIVSAAVAIDAVDEHVLATASGW